MLHDKRTEYPQRLGFGLAETPAEAAKLQCPLQLSVGGGFCRPLTWKKDHHCSLGCPEKKGRREEGGEEVGKLRGVGEGWRGVRRGGEGVGDHAWSNSMYPPHPPLPPPSPRSFYLVNIDRLLPGVLWNKRIGGGGRNGW